MNEQPKVYISILNWNGKDITRRLLKSLNTKTNYDNYDIYVVDNGSSDGSTEMIQSEFSEVNLIENSKNLGFSKGNNQVFKIALKNGVDYVVLLNNDVEVLDDGWLEEFIQLAENHPQLGILGCKTIRPDGEIDSAGEFSPIGDIAFGDRYKYNKYQDCRSTEENIQYVDIVKGAVFLLDTDLLREIGGFDEQFSPAYGEESDLCLRAWDNGYRVGYTSNIEMVHHESLTSNNLRHEYITYVKLKNKIRYILLNYPINWIVFSLPYITTLSLSMILKKEENKYPSIRKEILERPLHCFYYLTMAYLVNIKNFQSIMKLRNSRQDVKNLLK